MVLSASQRTEKMSEKPLLVLPSWTYVFAAGTWGLIAFFLYIAL